MSSMKYEVRINFFIDKHIKEVHTDRSYSMELTNANIIVNRINDYNSEVIYESYDRVFTNTVIPNENTQEERSLFIEMEFHCTKCR